MKGIKKIVAAALCGAAAIACAFGFAACTDGQETGDGEFSYSVYMPDGAPALSVAQLMAEDMQFGGEVDYNVVDASTIQTYVTGNTPRADICILPVNLAAQLLGTGESYKMLGTVTHGNLFLLSKTDDTQITSDNLSSLVGKSVGVVNLAAVPGLTFKVVLSAANIPYAEVGNSGEESKTAVNLYAISASDVGGTSYDYYVLPEPAATTMTGRLQSLEFVGDLQELYGGEDGYPQAVMVAKTTVIEENEEFIADFISAVEGSAEWLVADTTSMQTVVEAVQSHLTEGMTPTFTAENLNAQVIENCAIEFVAAAECKQEVSNFLVRLSAVAGRAFIAEDDFFYGYIS